MFVRMKKAKLFGVIVLSVAGFVANANANAEVSPETKANADLLAAIEMAEQHTGQLAFDAERADNYGNNYYSVEVTGPSGEPTTVWVDMNKGQVIDQRSSFADSTMLDENIAWYISIRNDWNISLTSAIKKAERLTGYNALRADFDGRGKDFYEIDLMSGTGKTTEVHVPAENDYGH